MTSTESAELLERWRGGDEEAARMLFRRYADQLVALARAHLPRRMTRRLDSEDVVQSAFRSFFAAARERGYSLQRSGDLWHLLAATTLNKLHRRVEHHSAQKRAVHREAEFPDGLDGVPIAALAADPSPEDAVALADEIESVLRDLDPLRRLIFELRLQDYTLDEIAAHTRRSERTVRRSLDQIKQTLRQRTLDHPA
jgi:RNA polymerase sigma factor (sigma-70 family)